MAVVHQGEYVWIQLDSATGPGVPFSAVVKRIQPNGYMVEDIDGKIFMVPRKAIVHLSHAPSPREVEDLLLLNELNEATIFQNLHLRYARQKIYTYVGMLVIAINPYENLPIYTESLIQKYRGKASHSLPSHLYATGDMALNGLQHREENQCIIISGESGAGKTESTKFLLQYFAFQSAGNDAIKKKILESNPIIEAFGNAKTIRNDNSSRFGKFISLQYNDDRSIILDARIDSYLLEKSRIVRRNDGEWNFHVFYYLVAGLAPEKKKAFGLDDARGFKGLVSDPLKYATQRSDNERFQQLIRSMQLLDFTEEEISCCWCLLAAMLHIGNFEFKESVELMDNGSFIVDHCLHNQDFASRLLGVPMDAMRTALTTKCLNTGVETIAATLPVTKAFTMRDALLKLLYNQLFVWITDKINMATRSVHAPARANFHQKSSNSLALGKKSGTMMRATSKWIGLLDIFGFENLDDNNSFEQLCINYSNECLQQMFIEKIFKTEEELYTAEGVKFNRFTYQDNHQTLDLIACLPMSILTLIDEECRMPRGTDFALLEKLTSRHASHPKFSAPSSLTDRSFGIHHFAGVVRYNVDGFIVKSRETFQADLARLIGNSNNDFLHKIFGNTLKSVSISRRQTKTLGIQFKNSMDKLMQTLRQGNPLFVRCIKPNDVKKPRLIEREVFIRQLRNSGVLETIHIRKHGYSNRHTFDDFITRYHSLIKESDYRRLRGRPEAVVNKICLDFLPHNEFQLGRTKIFLKDYHEKLLILEKEKRLLKHIVKIQSCWKRTLQRRRYKAMKRAAVVIQRAVRNFLARRRYKRNATLRKKNVQQTDQKIPTPITNAGNLKSPNRVKFESLTNENSMYHMNGLTNGHHENTNKPELGAARFINFASTRFLGGATPYFTQKRLSQPLLYHSAIEDRITSLKIWNLILKIMGLAYDNRQLNGTKYITENGVIGHSLNGTLTNGNHTHMDFDSENSDDTLNGENHTNLVNNRSKMSDESSLSSSYGDIRGLLQYGICQPRIRDEIYCQLCKQLLRNPDEELTNIVWTLLAFCASMFAPSEFLLPPIMSLFENARSIWAPSCKRYLRRTLQNGARTDPPGPTEFLAISDDQDVSLVIHCADGRIISVLAEPATNAADLCHGITTELNMSDEIGFSIFLETNDWFTSLGDASNHIMDAIAKVEQTEVERGSYSTEPAWKLRFEREIFVPWHDPAMDTVAAELTYYQVIDKVLIGDYRCENQETSIFFLACKCYVDLVTSHSMSKAGLVLENIQTWLTNQNTPLKREFMDIPKAILRVLTEDQLFRSHPSVDTIQRTVVQLARKQWPLWFSKFYKAQRFAGYNICKDEVVLCLNEVGFYVMDDRNQVARYFPFPDLFHVSSSGVAGTEMQLLTLTTIWGQEFTITMFQADELKNILYKFLVGLKLRSKFAIAVRDAEGYAAPQSEPFSLKRGDLIVLDRENASSPVPVKSGHQVSDPVPYPMEHMVRKGTANGWCRGENQRTRRHANFPTACLYILPCLNPPDFDLLDKFKSVISPRSNPRKEYRGTPKWSPSPGELRPMKLKRLRR